MTDLSGVPPLRDPVMVAAFEGWNDAGEAASGAVAHLERVWGAENVGELDPEEYHDFQVNRPSVGTDDDGHRTITWPTTRVYWARPPGGSRDIVIVRGIEPSMRWRRFIAELLQYADDLKVGTMITLGALLADVPHTRPIPVTTTSDDERLLDKLSVEPSRYEGPTGIVGVLQDAATKAGLPSLSLWAAVPHYVGQSPSPKATLALLRRIEDVLDVTVPLGELPEDARAWERGVDELAEEDTEIGEYVRQLEQAKDTADLPEASGEAIAKEFERYLRRRGKDDDGGKPGML
ncbi:PAC2 family protein [Kineosporia succinea]|uniref:Proteasome assembly chaperone (PAC2) family protein n=1 Tax=Kineosporia succinea TaxID=84632 RepID=A0ABT9P982_9ACTN|nr:PAC2 family protein [Kineosporia succinea]MDP9828720.1 proteasome assembly chaperone (PAC2) family protein [Kineosporia succinea]